MPWLDEVGRTHIDQAVVRQYNESMGKEKLTASALRKNIYNILDEVLDTGLPATIERKGRTLQIIALDPPSRLSRLSRKEFIVGDPEDFVSMDWSDEWRP